MRSNTMTLMNFINPLWSFCIIQITSAKNEIPRKPVNCATHVIIDCTLEQGQTYGLAG